MEPLFRDRDPSTDSRQQRSRQWPEWTVDFGWTGRVAEGDREGQAPAKNQVQAARSQSLISRENDTPTEQPARERGAGQAEQKGENALDGAIVSQYPPLVVKNPSKHERLRCIRIRIDKHFVRFSQPGQSGRNRRPDDGITAHTRPEVRLPDAVRLLLR